jgi:sugar-specific transcriptional regulator TrmB
LLDTQQTAARELAELEERLEKIRAPWQERLRAYEKRIADLERKLTAKSEENRTLTEAKISIVQKQLEIQRGKIVTQRN